MYYCLNDDNWHHVDPEQECFLIACECKECLAEMMGEMA